MISTSVSLYALRFFFAEGFRVSLVSFFLFSVIEELMPGTISRTLEVNVLLWAAVAFGMLTAVFPEPPLPGISQQRTRPWSRLLQVGIPVAVGFAVAMVIYMQLQRSGAPALLFAFVLGMISFAITFVGHEERAQNGKSDEPPSSV